MAWEGRADASALASRRGCTCRRRTRGSVSCGMRRAWGSGAEGPGREEAAVAEARDPHAATTSSSRSSGSTASGWRWWWTTGCPPRTGSCSSCTRQRAASSGARCWRRPTPSKCPPCPSPGSLPPAALRSGKQHGS